MPAMGGFKIGDAPDLDQTGGAPGKAVVVAGDGVTFELATVSGGGGVDAEDVVFAPAGGLSAADVQAALEELDAEKQPLDSDLTAIAALTTTAFGRGLLTLANQAALLAAAGAAASSHGHAGEDITSGTVADARIAASIARDAEVTAAIAALSTVYQPLDSDLTAIAALTTTAFGRSILEAADAAALRTLAAAAAAATQIIAGDGLTGGGTLAADRTLTVNVDGSTLEISGDAVRVKDGGITVAKLSFDPATQAELDAAISALSAVYQPLDADLTALAALATDAAGRSILILTDPGADRIAFWDDSAGTITWLQLGTNLSITGTTLNAAGGGGGSGDALTLDVAQTAHGLDVGDWVRLDSSGDYVVAQADSAENAEVVGIVIAEADANNFTIQRNGYVTDGLSGLTPGAVYYLSPSAAGTITATEPTTDGHVSKPVLIAETATAGWLAAEMRGVIVPGAGDPVAAADVSIADAGGDFTATDVEGALAELQSDAEADATALADHLADATAAHAASAISVDSTALSGTGTTVQASLEEIDNLLDDHSARHENGGADEISIAGLDGTPTELTNHLNDASDAHDASAISLADAGGHFDATEVEAALTELAVAARVGRFFLSAAGSWPSTTSGAAANEKVEYPTNDVDLYVLAFDATAQEFAQATLVMPPDWDGGTITAQFYWTKDGTNTNAVVWGCQGRSYGDGDAIDQAWGTAQEVTDAGLATDDAVHISAATAAITLAGTPAAGELVQLRIYRDPADGSDTFAADARLLGVMIAYGRVI